MTDPELMYYAFLQELVIIAGLFLFIYLLIIFLILNFIFIIFIKVKRVMDQMKINV